MSDIFDAITKEVCELFDTFGRKRDAGTVRGWARALQGLSLEQIQFGISKAMRECTELPAPAGSSELRQGCNGIGRTISVDHCSQCGWPCWLHEIRLLSGRDHQRHDTRDGRMASVLWTV